MEAAIVLDEQLGPGYLANAAACIATGIFREAGDVYGAEIQGADCTFISITKIGIPILRKGHKDFPELLKRAQTNGLKTMIFTREAQSTNKYDEYIRRVQGKKLADLTIIGIGVIGEDAAVTKFAGDLPLLR
ncbi:DUF2000 domain-containing protein [Candidatus Peregrinibacteria bacterium]|nr:DUF2000 domain-containing protein [Candidatus Peregrinibacteria bacterium]MBI3816859.1 DUF2000 domain-containing protein [Candidatus Peregrinibacteria bacterium]